MYYFEITLIQIKSTPSTQSPSQLIVLVTYHLVQPRYCFANLFLASTAARLTYLVALACIAAQ